VRAPSLTSPANTTNYTLGYTSTHRREKKHSFSRHRTHQEGKDIDFINSKNAHFNKKLERVYKDHSMEIKANLERGTALPDR
jgi:pre-mRNA-splicing factor SYF2